LLLAACCLLLAACCLLLVACCLLMLLLAAIAANGLWLQLLLKNKPFNVPAHVPDPVHHQDEDEQCAQQPTYFPHGFFCESGLNSVDETNKSN
jgi:hypothetical protein